MRRAALCLVAIVAASPILASGEREQRDVSRVEIVLAPITARDGAVMTASRIDLTLGESEVRLLDARDGVIALDGPTGSRWRVEVRTPGFWIAPRELVVGEETRRLTSPAWPTGAVTGSVEVAEGAERPAALDIWFESPADSPSSRRVAGRIECPIEDGRFACDLPAGLLDLRLRAPGFVSHYRWGDRIEVGERLSVGTLRLEAGASVAGWVATSSGRLDPERAEVRLVPLAGIPSEEPTDADRERWLRLGLVEHPDERGFFHFEGVPTGQYALVASHPGFAAARRSPIPVSARTETTVDGVLLLEPPRALEVFVDPAADPQGRAWRLRLSRIDEFSRLPEPLEEIELSPDGWHRWKGLTPGEYDLTVRDLDGATRWKETIPVGSGPNVVQAEIPTVRIRGAVRVGREPLPARLLFHDPVRGERLSFETDEEGRFEGVLPREGAWDVRVRNRPEGVNRSMPGIEVEVSEASGWATVDVRVPNTNLRGQVVDELGQPTPAGLAVMNLGEQPMGSRTEADGSFEIRGLEPGRLQIHAQAADGSDRTDLRWVTVTEDLEAAPVRLVLRERIRVVGEVISPEGPVPGARVELVSVDHAGPFVEEATTDVRGQFEIAMQSGTRVVLGTAEAPGFPLRAFRAPVDPASPLSIAVGGTGGELVLELPEGLDRLFGRATEIVVLQDGDWIPIDVLGRWASFQGARPEEPGEVRVPRVEAGRYLACAVPWERLTELVVAEPAGDPACAVGYLAPGGVLRLEIPDE